MSQPQSRRDFVASSAGLFGAAWVGANLPLLRAAAENAAASFQANLPFKTLTDAEAKAFIAFAAQIIPTDETPGATEAGAVYFLDNVIGSLFKELLFPVRVGLKQLDEKSKAADAAVSSFADLKNDQQVAVLKEFEKTQFFFVLRMVTVIGTFSHPKWGGGRDDVGFKILGLQHQAAYQAPFGYYDAEEMKANQTNKKQTSTQKTKPKKAPGK
ncbi:MAG TPA: gluconate 2-dehydrogenase subunit 3 family protein [Longimicrobiales bacterium]|nr:gluconate 2-dehydrogenase subunit 3 family protein [Longimicrobiales bacterium]